jgi:hypothetical protein
MLGMFHQLRDELSCVSNEIKDVSSEVKEVRKEMANLTSNMSNEIKALFAANNELLCGQMDKLRDQINTASKSIAKASASGEDVADDIDHVKKAIKKVITEALSAASHSNEELVKQEMRQMHETMLAHFKSLEEKQEQATDASRSQLKELQVSLQDELGKINGGIECVLHRVATLQASQEEFQRSLDTVAKSAALGNQQCRDGLEALEKSIKVAFETNGQLQLDALRVMGTDLSEALHRSISQMLAPYAGDTSAAAAAVQTDLLRELLGQVQEIKAQSVAMSEQFEIFMRLSKSQHEIVASMEADTNKMPHSFVVYPKPQSSEAAAVQPSRSSVVNTLTSFAKRTKSSVTRLFFDISIIQFYCPVTGERVPCGPDGNGYKVRVPNSLLKTVLPALSWGVFFLRVALSTQGMGSVVPPIEGLLDSYVSQSAYLDAVIGELQQGEDDALNGVANKLQSASEKRGPAVKHAYTEEQTKQAYIAIFELLKKAEGGKSNAEDWKTGLVLVKPNAGLGKSAWVSKKGKDDFQTKGTAAFMSMAGMANP